MALHDHYFSCTILCNRLFLNVTSYVAKYTWKTTQVFSCHFRKNVLRICLSFKINAVNFSTSYDKKEKHNFNYNFSLPAFKTCQSVLNEEIVTTVDVKATGQSSILCPGMLDSTSFNGHSGAIKTGLSHLAIPRGWSWGGPASPFCPIWAEIKVPDWQKHTIMCGNNINIANFVSSAVLLIIQCLLMVLLHSYFNWD